MDGRKDNKNIIEKLIERNENSKNQWLEKNQLCEIRSTEAESKLSWHKPDMQTILWEYIGLESE